MGTANRLRKANRLQFDCQLQTTQPMKEENGIHNRRRHGGRILSAYPIIKALLLTSLILSIATGGEPDFCDNMPCDTASQGSVFKEVLDGFAEEGIIFSGDMVHVYQGVVDGGNRRHDKFGGLATYGATFDMGKLGLTQGTFLNIRAQSQFGESINADTGALLIAANTNALLPSPDEQATAITDVLLTQFLSETFAVFAGRLNTFGGDMNAFAHGLGKTQFMNVGLGTNPAAFRTVPYVTYGAGFSILRDLEPIATFSVIDPNDFATRTDLDELFNDGVTLSGEMRLPFEVAGRPSHALLGGTWSNRAVVDLSQIARLPFQLNQPIPSVDESWSVFGNFDHYLRVYDQEENKGWGLFGRWAVADGRSNPFDWFLSTGIGGNSPISGRQQDAFGLGWYYAGITDAIPGLVFSDDSQGAEAFYSIALNEGLFLSPDVQWIHSSRGNVDDAWVMGLRLFMTL